MVLRFTLPLLFLIILAMPCRPVQAQEEPGVDLVSIEKKVTALSKAVERYDRDASRFLEKELLPALLTPGASPDIRGF